MDGIRATETDQVGASGRGKLVAICGIDGAGKATQTALLAQRAQAEGFAVQQVSFPRYGEGFFADLVERYLRGEFAARAAEVSPYLAALPYACDRWEAGPRLREWLAKGCLVLCNRYVPANLAHQGCKISSQAERRVFFQWVDRLEYEVFNLPRPSLHVLLDIEPAHAAELLRRRDRAEGRARTQDIHEKDMSHLEATAETYRQLASDSSAPWAVIPCVQADALLPPEDIAERVWAAVRGIVYNGA